MDEHARISAYYTHIDSGEAFEKTSRTGPYADIVVRVLKKDQEHGRLVFHRRTSYLPVWQTASEVHPLEELIARRGDGDATQPDRVNAHSHVRLIEATSTMALIHWRYVPEFDGDNPHTGMNAYTFVDEYFRVHADGRLERSVRCGTQDADQWCDADHVIRQACQLGVTGITDVNTQKPATAGSPKGCSPAPIRELEDAAPVCCLLFDEGQGRSTFETVSGTGLTILGPSAYWRPGVSGAALQFDGYTSQVVLPNADVPVIRDALTLEAWIALGAYPWNWAPIVQQGDDVGYFLGVNGDGQAGLRISVGTATVACVGTETLERFRWYHLAGTYDAESGRMQLFVNGDVVATADTGGGPIALADDDIKIGKGPKLAPTRPVRASTFASDYGFDGLIDEVRIYDQALTPSTLAAHVAAQQPASPDAMARRALPDLPSGAFAATYTHLDFYETWDKLGRVSEHPDIVVSFEDLPTRFVFWRAMSYVPMLVNGAGQWYSNEFNETWNTSGGIGCQEPMSDKQNHFSHVRLIEDTPGRKVVHWRYALKDVNKVVANFASETGWGDYSDWYYYIYPDGMAVKTMRLWTHGLINHEWQETMAIFGPDQHPEDIVNTKRALTLLDLHGNAVDYSWEHGPPENIHEPIDKCIQYVHYRGPQHPVTIVPALGRYDVYNGEVTDYSVVPTWNHWPVAQILSDGRYAMYPDRTAHSSLTHFIASPHRSGAGPAPFQERVTMEGMTDLSPEALVPMARGWLQPPQVLWPERCSYLGYEVGQRAHIFRSEGRDIGFHIHASDQRPIWNLCLEIKCWGRDDLADVVVDGVLATGCKQGVITDTDGTQTLLIWLDMKATGRFQFQIKAVAL